MAKKPKTPEQNCREVEEHVALGAWMKDNHPALFDRVTAIHENSMRKDYHPLEVPALYDDLLKWETLFAEQRMRQGIKASGLSGKGKAREIAARPFRRSPATIEQLREIKRAIDTGELPKTVVKQLGKGRSVKKVILNLQQRRKERERDSFDVPPDQEYPILHCPFWEMPVAPGSVKLILTDPPWNDEGLNLIEPFLEFADVVLADDGVIALYPGNRNMPQWCAGLGTRFEYVWNGAVIYVTQDGTRISPVRFNRKDILQAHQPVLIYSRPGCCPSISDTDTVLVPHWEKKYHDWEQSPEGMAHWLNCLTREGDLVVEPFCGGGTVPFICKKYKRRCVACDIDETAIMASRKRLESE